ncbi:MAG: class I SAM-dependent methyltransferase [Caulobacterales bacterium]|nr:class I SAM-dependent methyltransferase [Caulobacterales bacterium]
MKLPSAVPSRLKRHVKRALSSLGVSVTLDGDMYRTYHAKDPLSTASKILSPELTKRADWSHQDLEFQQLKGSEYYRLWEKHKGGHKKYSYFHLYDKLFLEYSGQDINLLEIGVYQGASARAWKEFFGAQATIVGIDIDPDCARFDAPENDVHVRIGSQDDPNFLKGVCNEFGPFDIIIDDGSHMTHHVIASFNALFADCLKEGGIYFIEDLETSYWLKYRTSKHSAMDMVLNLCEMMNQVYFENKMRPFSRTHYRKTFRSPRINAMISEVRVFDSAAAIYKRRQYPPLIFHT